MATNSIALAVANRMNMREALIAPQSMDFSAVLGQLMSADVELEEAAAHKHRDKQLLGRYGYDYDETVVRKPFAYADGVAIIPVQGALINRCDWSWGGWITGYNFIRSQVTAAAADPDVETIVLDCDSGGGEAAGCFELCDDIYAARESKQILAVVDSNCYSACYAVASAAHKIIVTPSGGAGSIGVVATHVDVSQAMKANGVVVTFVYAGSHKVDGNPFEPLPEPVRESIQANVDLSYDAFVAQVVRNRGLDEKAVRDTQAQIFRAPDALKLGLIDAVQPPSKALSMFIEELMNEDLEGDDDDDVVLPADPDQLPVEDEMTIETKPAVIDQAAHDTAVREAATTARVQEKARVSGIMGCEEAAGRSALANHLAMNTEMSVIEAQGVLKASAKEVAPAAASGGLNVEMSLVRDPDLAGQGVDEAAAGGASGVSAEQAQIDSILNAQAGATGVKHKKSA